RRPPLPGARAARRGRHHGAGRGHRPPRPHGRVGRRPGRLRRVRGHAPRTRAPLLLLGGARLGDVELARAAARPGCRTGLAGPVPAPDPVRRRLVPAPRRPGQLAVGVLPLPVHPRPPRPPSRRPTRDLAGGGVRQWLSRPRRPRPRSPSRPSAAGSTRPRASRPWRRWGRAVSTWPTPARPPTWWGAN